MLIAILLVPAAAAFGPDRPGVGESGASVPKEEVMIEAGAALGGALGQVPVLLLPSTVGRIGTGKGWEVRVGTPSIVVPMPGPVSASGLSLGTKYGRDIGSDWAWSLVPTARLAPLGSGALVEASALELSANLTQSAESWGTWLNATGLGALSGDVAGGAGGGAWYGPDDVGLFFNTGWYGAPLVGGGGWWSFAPRSQVDLGVDVNPGDVPVITVSAGASVQR